LGPPFDFHLTDLPLAVAAALAWRLGTAGITAAAAVASAPVAPPAPVASVLVAAVGILPRRAG